MINYIIYYPNGYSYIRYYYPNGYLYVNRQQGFYDNHGKAITYQTFRLVCNMSEVKDAIDTDTDKALEYVRYALSLLLNTQFKRTTQGIDSYHFKINSDIRFYYIHLMDYLSLICKRINKAESSDLDMFIPSTYGHFCFLIIKLIMDEYYQELRHQPSEALLRAIDDYLGELIKIINLW